jgi:hypothetical protein
MKKNYILVALIITTSLIISGCNSAKQEVANNEQQSMKQGQRANSGNNRGQFQNPDEYGEVTSINGNELNLKIMEVQNFGRNGQSNGGENRQQNLQGDGQGNGQNNRQSDGKENRQGNRPDMTPKYTGAEKKVNITESAQIFGMQRPQRGDNGNNNINTTGGAIKSNIEKTMENAQNDNQKDNRNENRRDGLNGGPGMNQQTIQLKDIKIGDVVSIWYSDKEKLIVSRVMVRGGNTRQ